MTTKKTLFIIVASALVLMAVGTVAYRFMDGPVAIHWNAQGLPDGYGSAFTGIYLLPLAMVFTAVVVIYLPGLDPMRGNVAAFRPDLNVFALVVAGFLGYMYLVTLAFNLGWMQSLNRAIAPAVAGLLFGAGMLVGRAKRNYMAGIRTPWTLASDVVWEKTHARGRSVFLIASVLSLGGILLPELTIWLVLVPVLGGTVYLVVYSYLVFRALPTNGEHGETRQADHRNG